MNNSTLEYFDNLKKYLLHAENISLIIPKCNKCLDYEFDKYYPPKLSSDVCAICPKSCRQASKFKKFIENTPFSFEVFVEFHSLSIGLVSYANCEDSAKDRMRKASITPAASMIYQRFIGQLTKESSSAI